MGALRNFSGAKVFGYAFAAAALACILQALAADQIKSYGTPVRGQIHRPASSPPPRPVPQLNQMLTREQAVAINDVRPIALGGLQTALSFNYSDKLTSPVEHQAAIDCLTAAVYYEAGGESEEGQRAVAQVVLNRVRHPAFPQTVCGVVYQGSELPNGCQFTFACDGSLARQPSRSGWERARRIAQGALAGRVEPSVGMATHYHANWVVPYWAASLDKIATVGSHIFYRWRGYWGQRQAFDKPYAGEVVDAPRLTYAEQLLGAWDENPAQRVDLSATHDARSRDDLLDPLQPHPAADFSVRKLVADDAPGRLVVDGSKPSAPDAVPLTPAP